MTLTRLFDGEYDDWQGLKPHLSLPELRKELEPVQSVRGPEVQSRTYQQFNVTHFSRYSPPTEVDAWSTVGQETVNILEFSEPPMRDLEATLTEFGTPELLLEDQRYAAGMRVKDYVYAGRGICFSVGEPFPPAPSLPRRAVFLQLFPASSVQFYVTDIGTGVPTGPRSLP